MSLDISQMMDGELDDEAANRLLAKLREDEQARQAWEHYHVIGDALRGTAELAMPGASGGRSQQLQQRVFAALAQEPTVLAPPVRRTAPARWVRYSVAAAATVAAFGLFSWFSPLEQAGQPQQIAGGDQWLRPAAPLPVQLGATAASAPATNLEDPYVEAHFEVSPAIRPSIMRAAWQPDGQR